MTTPRENSRGKKRKFTNPRYGGGGDPPIGKRPIYFRFFLLKASLMGFAGGATRICQLDYKDLPTGANRICRPDWTFFAWNSCRLQRFHPNEK